MPEDEKKPEPQPPPPEPPERPAPIEDPIIIGVDIGDKPVEKT